MSAKADTLDFMNTGTFLNRVTLNNRFSFLYSRPVRKDRPEWGFRFKGKLSFTRPARQMIHQTG